MNTDLRSTSIVTAAHRAKLAYVYIRQSSVGQVIRHSESTDLQYCLLERAVNLGWPRDRVRVIDDDLGKSGASAQDRLGFQSLIADVGLGQVGLVISLDASRMARNNSDWYQLLDLCSIFGVLIADSERLYDPRTYHDRLILGLSGMMSEAELHQLRIRLHAGARHKAERGELRTHLPVGLLRLRDGAVVLNPDEEVQARLRLIFSKFAELGSARAVRNYLAKEHLLVPARPNRGPVPNDTQWELPRSQAILHILHNPAYAGAYVYGRRVTDPARRKPGQPGSGVIQLPIDKWAVCLKDVYPAYISWETYLANQARLQANRNEYNQGGKGVPREGKALLQGIVICGRCGRRLSIRYTGPQGTYPVYRCSASAKEFGGPLCQEVRALGLDAEVERLLLAALEPERITLALEALDQLELEMKTLERQWQLRLDRARYESQRAQRQYHLVEPENRLVARQLEKEWEEKLRALELVEQEYEAWKRENRNEITPEDRREILSLGEDLPKVWNAETTTNADRKYLLQLLIKEVIVDQKREAGKLWFQINWQTGAATPHIITRTCISYREHGEVEKIKQRVRELNRQGLTDKLIAERLNAEGLRTTYGEPFNYKNIHDLRQRWEIPNVKEAGLNPDRLRWADGSYTVRGVVETIGVTKDTVHGWLKKGLIKGTQLGSYMLWKINLTEAEIKSLRQRARGESQKKVALPPSPAERSKCCTLISGTGLREGRR
jgi:DNA invertase Pin-like site-specific DNA recombinase